MANKAAVESHKVRPLSAAKDLERTKLRRANCLIDASIANLEQVKDILKKEHGKAALIIDTLKRVDSQTEDVLSTLGY